MSTIPPIPVMTLSMQLKQIEEALRAAREKLQIECGGSREYKGGVPTQKLFPDMNNAIALLLSLISAIAELERGWQPIETCDTTGFVLFYCADGFFNSETIFEVGTYDQWHLTATHWMPLPHSPTGKDSL